MISKTSARLVKVLKEHSYTIAIAESMTCGLAADRLGKTTGTSNIFLGSIVCYHENVKMDLMGISKKLLERFTAESMEVTIALAKKLRNLIPANIHVAITGLASKGGSETNVKPVGTTFIAVSFKGKMYTLKKRYYGQPLIIRKKAVEDAFDFVRRILREMHSKK